jgi:hypothetical protein
MQLNIKFDLDQQVFALMPNGPNPTSIVAGTISRVDVVAQKGEEQSEGYYLTDETKQQHIVPWRRIFITQQEAQDILDIINA